MDVTPLDQLIPAGGAQQPALSLPASTTYPQMVTPGTTSAIYTPPPPAPASNPIVVKSVLKNILMYVSIFLSVVIISMTNVQSMVLRYVPGSYSGSGVVSLTGAGVLGALGVFLVYVIQVLLAPLI
jgi:uncharacterized integral membrane protein